MGRNGRKRVIRRLFFNSVVRISARREPLAAVENVNFFMKIKWRAEK
jgi:hypothetical protein